MVADNGPSRGPEGKQIENPVPPNSMKLARRMVPVGSDPSSCSEISGPDRLHGLGWRRILPGSIAGDQMTSCSKAVFVGSAAKAQSPPFGERTACISVELAGCRKVEVPLLVLWVPAQELPGDFRCAEIFNVVVGRWRPPIRTLGHRLTSLLGAGQGADKKENRLRLGLGTTKVAQPDAESASPSINPGLNAGLSDSRCQRAILRGEDGRHGPAWRVQVRYSNQS